MFKTTIESIVSDIQTKINQLRDVAEAHNDKAGEHREKQTKHRALAEFHVNELERATRIAEKFEELLK